MTTVEQKMPTASGPEPAVATFDKGAAAAGMVALIGVLTSVFLMLTPTYAEQMLGSWAFGYIFWIGVTLGFFGLSLLHHTVRGSWGVPVLRLFEAGGGYVMFAVFLVLFAPLALDVAFGHHLYHWADPEAVVADAILAKKAWYLNTIGFVGRALVFFALWIALSRGMAESTRRQEQNGEFKLENGRMSWGAIGLVMFVLTATFAFIDWAMSLEPHWYSSMYPVWNIINTALGGLSLATLLLCLNAHKIPYRDVVSPKLTKDLGNLLFAFTMLWAYTSVSQYLIIWNGNIPEFTQYFVRRSHFGWNAIGLALIIGQFLVPWFALLAPRTKKTPERLAKVAAWIFLFHILDVFHIIVPAIPGRPWNYPLPTLFDLIAFVTIGAVWWLVFAIQSRKAPLLPAYDHRLQEELSHAH